MAGVTSLLRSAQAAQKKIKAQQDAQIAYDYANSAKTYDDYVRYTDYLTKRSKSVTDPSTALTLQKTFDSAYKGYISNEIQRATIDTLEGRGTSIDKYNKVYGFMDQAMKAGQYDLAQSLNLQLDNLYVNIQNEAQRAQDAAQRLSEAQVRYEEKMARAGAASNLSMGKSLERGLETLNQAFAKGGQKAYNEAAKSFVQQNKQLIESLTGQKLPKDASTNIGQVIAGTIKGIGIYYSMAADAVALTDPEKAVEYMDKAQQIASGQKKYKTPAGQLSYTDAQEFAKNQSLYGQVQNKQTGQFELARHALAGYQVDEQGNISKQASPYFQGQQPVDKKMTKADQKQLEKLGSGSVQYDSKTGQYTAQLSSKTNEWFKATDIGLPEGSQINLIKTAQGFQYVDPTGKNLYNIATDKNGLGAIYKIDNLNKQTHLAGQYGFDQSANSLIKRADFLQTKKQLDIFNKAVQAAQLAQQHPNIAPRIAAEGSKQVNQYLSSVGVKYYAPDKTNTAANIASENAILLQPYFQSRGQIGGKYYNAAGEFIPGYSQRNGGGFNFVDKNGKAISALTYAQQTKSDFGKLLSYLGSKGDTYAAQYAKNPGAAGSALTWR